MKYRNLRIHLLLKSNVTEKIFKQEKIHKTYYVGNVHFYFVHYRIFYLNHIS